jgi:Adenylate and Guanylate cyclase catalytic domain/GAF domain
VSLSSPPRTACRLNSYSIISGSAGLWSIGPITRLVHVPDLTQAEQVEGVRLAVDSGSRTLLFVPLRTNDVLLGTIVAVRQEVHPFGDKQIALLENFADIGFGVGISQGYATLGQIGFAERMDYTAIGTVTNLAARLCAEAKDGQILVSRRVAIAVEDSAELEEIGDLALKGLSQAVAVYNVVAGGAQASVSL